MNRLIVVLLASALSMAAADPSGKWSGTLTPANDDAKPAYVILKADGKKLSGSGGPNEGEQHSFENGTVEGDRLVFDVPADEKVFHFELKFKDDKIEGTLEMKQGGETRQATVSLARVP